MKELTTSNFTREISQQTCIKHGCPMVIYSTVTDKPLTIQLCEICVIEERQKRDNEKLKKAINYREYADYTGWLYTRSFIDDETIKLATIDNYIVMNQSQLNAKNKIVALLKMMQQGKKFNVAMHGNTGTGKSHLGFAMLKELNKNERKRCLFVNTSSLFTKLRSIYNGNQQYSEYEILRDIKTADYVVIDDLGSEVGKINTNTQASDYVVKVLYEILNSRQGKATIWNTNLSTKTLEQLYDRKILSRLFFGVGDKVVRFDWKDERMKQNKAI